MSEISLKVDSTRLYNLQVVDYRVSTDITPLAPGDSSGGVGSVDTTVITVKDGFRNLRTATIIDKDLILTDEEEILFTGYRGRGAIYGHATATRARGPVTSITATTLLQRLNTDRKADPFFGVKNSSTRVTYITNLATNPSLETATTNYTAIPGTTGVAALTRTNTGVAAYAGTYKGIITWTTAATAPGGVSYLQAGVTPGQVLNYQIRARANKAQTVRLEIDYRNSSNVVLTTVNGVVASIDASGYAKVTAIAPAAPTGTDNVLVRLVNYNSGTGTYSNWAISDTLIFDALMISGSTADYFDGSSANSSWAGTAHASTSQQTITETIDTGYDATIANAVRYYMGLVGIPTTSIFVDGVFEGVPVAYPGWTGNVWTYLKMLCVAVGAEIVSSGESVLFRQPRQHLIGYDNSASFDIDVDAQATALAVGIYNWNNRWLADAVAYVEESTRSVNVRSAISQIVTVPHSLTSVNQPQPATNMGDLESYVGDGQYVVMDANDVVVDPATWRAMGGNVVTRLMPDTDNKIEITVIGPSDPGAYTEPFRIAEPISSDNAGPAMYITGEGVFTNKELITLITGASLTQTSTEQAATIDNPFISTGGQAVDRGMLAAQRAGGPNITLTGFVNYDTTTTGRDFEQFVGGRIKYNDAYWRVKSVSFSPLGMDFFAEMDTTFGDATEAYAATFDEMNAQYVGQSFTTHNALYAGMTFDQVMALIPMPTFDQVNSYYAGLTFNDHALTPLLTKEEQPSDTEARL